MDINIHVLKIFALWIGALKFNKKSTQVIFNTKLSPVKLPLFFDLRSLLWSIGIVFYEILDRYFVTYELLKFALKTFIRCVTAKYKSTHQ